MNNRREIESMESSGRLIQFLIALFFCLGMASPVWAVTGPTTTGNNFTMISAGGGSLAGGTNDVVFTWDGTLNTDVASAVVNASIASDEPFFGFPWTAKDVMIYGPGDYTIYADAVSGDPACSLGRDTFDKNGNPQDIPTGAPCTQPITLHVGANQIGAHMLFDWATNHNIDVLEVWNVDFSVPGNPDSTNIWKTLNSAWIAADNPTYNGTPEPFWTGADNGVTNTGGVLDGNPNTGDTLFTFISIDVDGDGIPGFAMVDGAFPTFSANFNLSIDLCAGVTCDDANPCTTDTCDPSNGQCVSTNNALSCDDSDACTTNDVCSGGSCSGTPVICVDNGNPCDGTEQCNPADGSCTSVKPVSCLPGESCDPSNGQCTNICPDGDVDGYVDDSSGCLVPSGLQAGDCDDSDVHSYPGAPDQCDGVVNDCNSRGRIGVDPDPAWPKFPFYHDGDGDTYGQTKQTASFCSETVANKVGYVAQSGDCDDVDASVNPGAAEICNDVDDDCNGQVDDGLTFTDYCPDTDGDHYGDSSDLLSSCATTPPTGRIADCTDCDDSSKFRNPGLKEFCDGIDNDCNGVVDDPDQLTFVTYYEDQDGDGFGNLDVSNQFCETTPPTGWANQAGDCSGCLAGDSCGESMDQNASINPNAVETEGNNIDENCDGSLEAVVPIPPGRYVFDVNPDLPDVRLKAAGKPNLKSFFAFDLSNKYRAYSTYGDVDGGPNNGLAGNSAGLISFELVDADEDGKIDANDDFPVWRMGAEGPEQVPANLWIQGIPRGTDSSGHFTYPGDYKMGIFTSPGGNYVHYIQGVKAGKYDPATNSLELFLSVLDPLDGTTLNDVFADTENAGERIGFPYDPIGTGTYSNFKPNQVADGCEISSTPDMSISGKKISYNGKIFLYNGNASFLSEVQTDTNNDGTIDSNDTLLDANEDGVIDADDIPDDIAGSGVDSNGDGIGDDPDGIVDDRDMVDSWHATLAAAGNVPTTVEGFACISFVHVYDGLIYPSQNTPPIADAGEDVSAKTGEKVVLDGSGSSDAEDGTVTEYQWNLDSFPVASSAALIHRDTATPSITVDVPGEYVTSLVVKDSKGASSQNVATVTITVTGNLEGEGYGDLDSDGIPDWQDACPDDPKVTCKDTDHDGVLDAEDNSPGDPAMAVLTEGSCEILVRVGAGAGGTGGNRAALRHITDVAQEGINGLPAHSILISYDVDVSHPSLFRTDGAEIPVTINIPCDVNNPEVFKVIDGKVKTLKALGIPYTEDTDGSRTITFTLKDGGPGDTDGTVNGIIADPIGIGEATPSSGGGGGGGGGCALAGRPDAADALLLLLPIFALIGTRWARKRINK